MAQKEPLGEGQVLKGSLFNEPMRVETVRVGGDCTCTVGLVGTQSEQFRKVTLTGGDINSLTILDSDFSYDGHGRLLRLFRIGALDSGDALGVVPAKELLHRLGDALDSETPVDDRELRFILIDEALKMFFEEKLEDTDSPLSVD